MEKKNNILIMGLFILIFIPGFSSYTPPSYSNIDLVLNGSYIPPRLSNINLVLEEPTVDQPAENSCTYTSGNWEVECSDNCNIDSNVVGDGSNLNLNGTGNFNVNADISGFNQIVKDNNCFLNKINSASIQLG